MRMRTVSLAAFPAETPAFLLVGGLGFLFDLGLTLALAPALGAFAARPPAIALAILVTFALNRRLTFRGRKAGVWTQLLRYIAACAASQAFNYAVYCLLLGLALLAGWQGPAIVSLAAMAGSAAAAGLTFVLAKKWVFAAT